MIKLAKNFWGKVKEWYEDSAKNPSLYSYEETKDYSAGTFVLAGLFAAVVFSVYYLLAFTYALSTQVNDIQCHAEFACDFYFGEGQFLKAWLRVPYMLWHLVVRFLNNRAGFPLADATAFTYAGFGLFTYVVTALFISGCLSAYTGKKQYSLSFVGSFILSFVGPLCCMWLEGDAYMGSFSPNPMHNPTHMAVKGFGLLTMMAGIDIIRKYREEKAMFFKNSKALYLYFGIFLFLSTITKPTFMYMLLPAGMIVVLSDAIYNGIKKTGKAKEIWKAAGKLCLALVPSLVYLIFEYCAFYFWGEETNGSSVILTAPFEVWHMFTAQIKVRVLLAMCFPLFMLITRPGYFFRTVEGKLGIIGYLVGTVEFIFIAESNLRKDAGNFSWCMMAGMTVFFAVALVRLIIETLMKKNTTGHFAYVVTGWFLLFLHVYSCMYYYKVFQLFI